MDYNVLYACVSHVGLCRDLNQDNFICNGRYMDVRNCGTEYTLTGCVSTRSPALFGVFDGMGGEECGEIASHIAAQSASTVTIGNDVLSDLSKYCLNVNEELCKYTKDNGIGSMGTTAALLVFTRTEIVLCNIGDSKIFRFTKGKMEQISKDHVAISAYGTKPPLSQNLGISPADLLIEPYMAHGQYNNDDIFLICSDGLTDMVEIDVIKTILANMEFDEIATKLLGEALANGGRDNISIIICKIVRNGRWSFMKKHKAIVSKIW